MQVLSHSVPAKSQVATEQQSFPYASSVQLHLTCHWDLPPGYVVQGQPGPVSKLAEMSWLLHLSPSQLISCLPCIRLLWLSCWMKALLGRCLHCHCAQCLYHHRRLPSLHHPCSFTAQLRQRNCLCECSLPDPGWSKRVFKGSSVTSQADVIFYQSYVSKVLCMKGRGQWFYHSFGLCLASQTAFVQWRFLLTHRCMGRSSSVISTSSSQEPKEDPSTPGCAPPPAPDSLLG